MRGCAGDRLARASQRGEAGSEVDARAVNIDAVTPGHRGVDAGPKMKMPVFRYASVLLGKRPMHRRRGVDGIRNGLEAREQTVAEAFQEDTAMTRKYIVNDAADKVGPSLNAGGFVLAHEAHRLHQ